jgi:hypothetical protein
MMHRAVTVENCCTRTDWDAAIRCALGRAVLHGRKQQVWLLRTARSWVITDAL